MNASFDKKTEFKTVKPESVMTLAVCGDCGKMFFFDENMVHECVKMHHSSPKIAKSYGVR